MSDLCPICGNTGVDIDGKPCTCNLGRQPYNDSLVCVTIPAQYQGIVFSQDLIPTDVPPYYGNYMAKLYDDVTRGELRYKNIFLHSPARHSKSILAYTCIQGMFKRELPTFPLMDLGEIGAVLRELDGMKKAEITTLIEAEPLNVYKTPYLFVRINDNSYNAYDNLVTLLDRRTRRGLSTICISNMSWSLFTINDKIGKVKDLAGDGSFGSLEIKEFFKYGGEADT